MNNIKNTNDLYKLLFSLKDDKFRVFTSKLMPTIPIDNIIGVKYPLIKQLAKDITDESFLKTFLNDNLPHLYHEENYLHGLLIAKNNSLSEVFKLLDSFLPYVNSWAITDCIKPKVFKKYPKEVLDKISSWLNDDHPYTVRFAIITMLQFYLDDNYESKILTMISDVNNEEYYVKMAKAWFFSVALVKRYDDTIKILLDSTLDTFVHNKTIQKAIESFRISPEKKEYLKGLKRQK